MTPARTECCSHGFTSGVATGGASWQARSSETRNYRPPPVKAAAQQRAGAVAPTVHAIMSPWRAAQRATLARQQGVMGVAFSFGVSLVATVASLASFQIGYLWSFEELTAEADLVVIAERVGTDDTGRRTEHPDLKPGLPVVELATVFKVLAVLKVDTRATSSDTSRVQLKH